MRDELDQLRDRKRAAEWNATVGGKIWLAIGHAFAAYCVVRMAVVSSLTSDSIFSSESWHLADSTYHLLPLTAGSTLSPLPQLLHFQLIVLTGHHLHTSCPLASALWHRHRCCHLVQANQSPLRRRPDHRKTKGGSELLGAGKQPVAQVEPRSRRKAADISR